MNWDKIENARIWHWVLCPKENNYSKGRLHTIQGKPVTEIKTHISSCGKCQDCSWSWKGDLELKERLEKAEKEWYETLESS